MPLTSWKGRYLPIGIAEGCWSLLGGRVFMVGPLRWSGAPGTSNTATRGRLLVGLAAAAKEECTHGTDCSAPDGAGRERVSPRRAAVVPRLQRVGAPGSRSVAARGAEQ